MQRVDLTIDVSFTGSVAYITTVNDVVVLLFVSDVWGEADTDACPSFLWSSIIDSISLLYLSLIHSPLESVGRGSCLVRVLDY